MKEKNGFRSERGAVQIVEAAFVFPVVFIILFALIYMGNIFYVKTQVDSIVAEAAIKGAAYCTDPLLESIEGGSIPSVKDLSVKPYRYILTGDLKEAAKEIGKSAETAIESQATSFFKGMAPKVKTPAASIAKYSNHIFYSKFSVGVECTVSFPLKILGLESLADTEIASYYEVPVDDTPEFIRNTDMVIDYYNKFFPEGIGAVNTVKGIFEKINDFVVKFAKK